MMKIKNSTLFVQPTNVFFPQDNEKPVFFVANRGHHADIGGISLNLSISCLKDIDYAANVTGRHGKAVRGEVCYGDNSLSACLF